MVKFANSGALLLKVVLLLNLSLSAAIAEGVTQAPLIRDPDASSALTTSATMRAQTDIQIRRIKSMITSKKSDIDADYERLERLQRRLRGER